MESTIFQILNISNMVLKSKYLNLSFIFFNIFILNTNAQRRIPAPHEVQGKINYNHKTNVHINSERLEKIKEKPIEKIVSDKNLSSEYNNLSTERWINVCSELKFKKKVTKIEECLIRLSNSNKGKIEISDNLNNLNKSSFLGGNFIDFHLKMRFKKYESKVIYDNVKLIFDYGISSSPPIFNEPFDFKPYKKFKNLLMLFPTGELKKIIINDDGMVFYKNTESDKFYTEYNDDYINHELISKKLTQKTILNKEYLILSLIVNDKKTNDLIKKDSKSSILINSKNINEIETIIRKNKGKKIFIIGHIEDNKFISKDITGKVNFQKDIAFFDNLRTATGIDILPLGCNSIKNGSPVGYNQNINSINLIQQVKESLKANSISEFYNILSLENTPFFVSAKIINEDIKFEAKVKEIEVNNIKETNAKYKKRQMVQRAIIYSQILDDRKKTKK